MTSIPPLFDHNSPIPMHQESSRGSYCSDGATVSHGLEGLGHYPLVVETPQSFTSTYSIGPSATGMSPHPGLYSYTEAALSEPDHFPHPADFPYEHQFTTGQYDEPAVGHKGLGMAQAPLEPLDRRIACEHVRTRHASGHWCGESCIGQLNGCHQCLFPSQPPSIVCFGNSECRKIFRSRAGFNKHWSTKHRQSKTPEKRRLSCPFHGCSRIGVNGFSRPDNLRQHRRSVHGEDIPKEKRMFSGIRRAAGRVRKV